MKFMVFNTDGHRLRESKEQHYLFLNMILWYQGKRVTQIQRGLQGSWIKCSLQWFDNGALLPGVRPKMLR